jgi:predicted methyltransferase
MATFALTRSVGLIRKPPKSGETVHGLRAVTLAISIATGCAASTCVAFPNTTVKMATSADMALADAVASPVRSPQNVARDVYRHPKESLSFWGLKPGMAILEVWPDGGYWTEILAPFAKTTHGSYRAAMALHR